MLEREGLITRDEETDGACTGDLSMFLSCFSYPFHHGFHLHQLSTHFILLEEAPITVSLQLLHTIFKPLKQGSDIPFYSARAVL